MHILTWKKAQDPVAANSFEERIGATPHDLLNEPESFRNVKQATKQGGGEPEICLIKHYEMKLLFYALLGMAAVTSASAQPVPKRVVVEHFTNTYCSICASRNPGFYNNLATFPDVLHVAYHPSSPYPSCPLNQANVVENDARTNFYSVYGSTPRLVIQGEVIPANANYSNPTLFSTRQGQTTPFELLLTLSSAPNNQLNLTAFVIKVDTSSLQNALLYGAICEDTVLFAANNGETVHHDVFRKSAWGNVQSLNLPTNVGDTVAFSSTFPNNIFTDITNVHVVGILQKSDNYQVIQTAASNHVILTNDVSDIGKHKIALAPNPATHTLRLMNINQEIAYKIMDMHGRQISSGSTSGVVDVSTLAPGCYQLLALPPGAPIDFITFLKQ